LHLRAALKTMLFPEADRNGDLPFFGDLHSINLA
jgi:hypothetical protein